MSLILKEARHIKAGDRVRAYLKDGVATTDFYISETKHAAYLGGFRMKVDETGDTISVVCTPDDFIQVIEDNDVSHN